MEKKDLQDRLKRYYEGTLSSEEVRELIRFFREEDTPEGFETEKEIFSYLGDSADEPAPGGIEEKMSQLIDDLEKKEHRSHRVVSLYPVLAGLAATVALLLAVYLGFLRNPVKDTYKDPVQAYAETQRVLGFVSSKLNQGTKPMGLLAAAQKPAEELEKLNMLATPVRELEKVAALKQGMKTLQNNNALDKSGEILNKYLKINTNK